MPSSPPFHDLLFLALAIFGIFVFVSATGVVLVAVRLFPPPVNPLFPLPVIHGPAKITLRTVVDKGVCDSCAATLLDAHSKKRRGRPQGCDVDPSLKAGLRTSESRSSQVAVLHDYTASATLLWCVGIITLGHGPPNVGDHVVSGAVAVRDDAIGSKLAAAKMKVKKGKKRGICILTSWMLGSRGCVPGRDPHVAAS